MGSVNVDGHSKQPITASTPKELAQLFNHNFASVFSPSTIVIPPDDSSQVTGPVLSDIELTTDEVLKSLKMLNVNKATGSDGIPARLLRETVDIITPSLTKLFNKSLQHGIIPMNGRLLMLFLYTRKAGRIVWKIIDPFHCWHWSQNYSNVAYLHV